MQHIPLKLVCIVSAGNRGRHSSHRPFEEQEEPRPGWLRALSSPQKKHPFLFFLCCLFKLFFNPAPLLQALCNALRFSPLASPLVPLQIRSGLLLNRRACAGCRTSLTSCRAASPHVYSASRQPERNELEEWWLHLQEASKPDLLLLQTGSEEKIQKHLFFVVLKLHRREKAVATPASTLVLVAAVN